MLTKTFKYKICKIRYCIQVYNKGFLFLDPGLWLHQLSDGEPLLVDPVAQSGLHHQGLQHQHQAKS